MTEKTKRVADLVFLVDVTGSMQPCIDGLKTAIGNFFDYLTDEGKNALSIKDWRAKVVGYRDLEFDEDWIENNPFVSTVEEVRAQIAALDAHGGGDEPESLLDALLTVANMDEGAPGAAPGGYSWRNRREAARAVVVLTDATYHPRAQRPDFNGADYRDVARAISDKSIILEVATPVEPFAKYDLPEDEGRELQARFDECYKNLGKTNRGEWNPLKTNQGIAFPFAQLDRHTDKFREFMAQMAKTISASVNPDLFE